MEREEKPEDEIPVDEDGTPLSDEELGERSPRAMWLTYGLIAGIVIGGAVGTLTDNVGVWLALGPAIGVAIALGFSSVGK